MSKATFNNSNLVVKETSDQESTEDATRRKFFKFGAGAAFAALTTASIDAQAITPSTTWGLANVKDFGARGNGVNPDQAAFQNAMNYAVNNKWGGIYVPPGQYLLTAPVQVPGAMTIQGVGGLDYGGLQGTVILPTTVAFKPLDSSNLVQELGFVCKNIVFKGGTIPIDLGLRHECVFRDLTFINPSIAAISIVRGERHEFTNVRVHAQTTNCQYGLAFASPSITTIPGLSTFDYGSPGAWVDRLSVDKLAFIFGTSNYVQNAIYCTGTLSNFNSQHIVCQGIRGYVLYVGTRLQYSHISNLIIDQCNTSGALIYVATSLQNVFTDVSPGDAGNNVYSTGIQATDNWDSVFINCNVVGDNSSQYGFWFGANVGQVITLINCHGALYLNSVNPLQRNRITQVACRWAASNTQGSVGLSTVDDHHITLQLMADANGAGKSTKSVKIIAANGGGQDLTVLDASLAAVAVGGGTWNFAPIKFGNRYEWYDASGNKRAKVGAPTSDVDGVIISRDPVI